MSRLRIFNESDATTVITETRDHALIAELLAREAVRFERLAKRWGIHTATVIGNPTGYPSEHSSDSDDDLPRELPR